MDDRPAFDMTPRAFPCEAQAGWNRIRVISLSPQDYRAVSFLDSRFCDARPGAWLEGPVVRRAALASPRSAHFIFHIGHVGSTLLSRLLGEQPGLFSVREPALLRRLVEADTPADVADMLLRLFSRSFAPTETALIKATSFVGERAETLLCAAPTSRALLLFANPLAYMRGLLGGPASRAETRALAPARLEWLNARLGVGAWRLEGLSEGEQAAMSWLCGMSALHAAACSFPHRTLWLNFDHFLASPAAGLQTAVIGLGAAPSSQAIVAALDSSLMRTYAKAPEHAYDGGVRAEVALQAEREHGGEIRRGMNWLGAAAQTFPLVRAVLETAARQRLHP